MDTSIIQNNLHFIIPAVSTGIVFVVARIFPKKKAVEIASKCEYLGKIVSTFGNTKLGKSAMSTIEEGAIVTILGFISTCITSFSKGLVSDNTIDK